MTTKMPQNVTHYDNVLTSESAAKSCRFYINNAECVPKHLHKCSSNVLTLFKFFLYSHIKMDKSVF